MSQDRIHRLQQFVEWSAQHITGDEKGQAQIFLDRLLQAFGQPGLLEVGGTPEFRIKKGKDEAGGTSFADYVWKRSGGGVLIEMKKRGTDLARTRQQAFDYWIKLVPNRPQYAILCNFDEFWIYDFNIDLDEPLDKLTIAELPQRYDPLAFLFPTLEPLFGNNRVEITRNAADRLASVFGHMVHVRKINRELAQRFILQMLVALFAEDIDLLPRNFVTNLLADIKSPEDSYDLIGGLFEAMNRAEGTPAGRFKGIRYFNGGLFANPAKLALDRDNIELAHLRNAAKENWSKVSPDIFGTLFQHSMDQPERHAFGAHYTAPIDIMKIVKPTIVDPWTQLIDNAKKPKQLADLLERLSLYQVLDPACGSGNFLYLAYRELKRLEIKIRDRLRTEFPEFQATIYHVTARQFHGMDIIPFAIELATVTMMLARKLAIDELHIADEPPLPLDNLDQNFLCTDALLSNAGVPPTRGIGVPPMNVQPLPSIENQKSKIENPVMTPWPSADAIIGNPPFLGAKRLKPERGPDYVNTLRDLYPEIPGMADYCVYWLRRAHDHLPICTPDRPESGRAGLVGTQNIRNNQSRVGGLDYIVKSGTIVEAVENQPWSGEANVHVSIANWVKTAAVPTSFSPVVPTPSSAVPVTQASRLPPSGGPEDRLPVAPGGSPGKTPPVKSASPEGATPMIDPAKLLIPTKKKLWFKIDPKLALFNQSPNPRTRSVTTTGKSGKTLASKSYELDFREGPQINAALSTETDVTGAALLKCNVEPPLSFNGQMLGHKGFLLTHAQREEILRKDKKSGAVIFPYLNGREVLSGNGRPDRYVLDFDQLNQIDAGEFHGAFEWVRKYVYPDRLRKAQEGKDEQGNMRPHHKAFISRWWQLSFGRPELLSILKPLPKYLVCSLVTKRPIFVFVSSAIRPSNLLQVFALSDDYSFGILQSNVHWEWFKAKSSKLKSDYRFGENVWNTFPWPQSPTRKQIQAIVSAVRNIRHVRDNFQAKNTGGLRALYRSLESAGEHPLKSAHAALDAAVLTAYGFSPAQDSPLKSQDSPAPDLLQQLLTLNLQVAANIESGNPVTAPGVPHAFGDIGPLITSDCIAP